MRVVDIVDIDHFDFRSNLMFSAKIEDLLGLGATTAEKISEARELGFEGILETDEAALNESKASFDFLLSTIPQKHDINPFIPLLKRDKTLCVCGALEPLEQINNMGVAPHRYSIAGSLIGSFAA